MDDVHIKILKIVQSYPNGISHSDLADQLGLSMDETNWVFEEAGHRGNALIRQGGFPEGQRIFLGMQGKSILLQHFELKQARNSSRIAIYISIAAMILTAIIGIYGIQRKKVMHNCEKYYLKEINSTLIGIKDSINVNVFEPVNQPSDSISE